jgi:hypothetical protein
VDTTTHAIVGLQHQHSRALILEQYGSLQASKSGTDDDDVRVKAASSR